MSTLGDIAETVARKILNRDDAAEDFALVAAQQAYKTICGKVPFDELMTTSSALAVTSGTNSYDLASLLSPNILAGIVSIQYTASSTNVFRLRRSHARSYDALGAAQSGIPRSYARWNTSIEFSPTPNASTHTFRVRYWAKPYVDSSDPASHTLLLPEEWEELLVWETLRRCYLFLQEFEKANSLMHPAVTPQQYNTNKTRVHEIGIIPSLWNDLLETITWREYVDEDFSVNPVRRPYGGR